MPRAIVLVLDSFGIGAAPDAARFGDAGADTLGHIAAACVSGELDRGPLQLPNLARLGLFHAHAEATGQVAAGVELIEQPEGAWAHAAERSTGKDTPSGHWELAGVPVLEDFGYFPDKTESFPEELLEALIRRAELPGVLGNCHASGTEIIERLGAQHIETGKPIVYTSADSVFQIAAHEEHFGLDRLYRVCEIARELLMDDRVGRVIARPFVGDVDSGFQRTGNRRDYSLEPPAPTVLDKLLDAGGEVLAIGKIGDIFAHRGVSRVIKADGNEALVDATLAAMDEAGERSLVFTNLVDFDMLYGHRRDTAGYAAALEAFDRRLPEIIERLRPDDLLILVADHGCDPSFEGSDHTREFIPVLALGAGLPAGSLGRRESFADVGQTLAEHFGLPPMDAGLSFLPLAKARLEQLHKLRDRAYAPYSGFTVAALIETRNGHWFGGCNVETAHYKSVCAEASAISAMIAAGEREIRRVHILAPGGRLCAPCGDCRQRLLEFSGPDARVHLLDNHGMTIEDHAIAELLPAAFVPDDLD
ncbi:phosphopentomutase [Wenzhouxiangella marina]|uniref:Phosphopentomutase n=1 Tax=Wenzhouxiangella marina TaxID=1579979 RepID=A0A0K0XUK8_9GAMM|nr:phosphopentomutase [Wenzhouxiangella marina]AKS41350.1 Phosphopentomutase [Wenzhouxiangella marina]MBB6086900.1 phosphopentomutase [Wenzhouxiangella marina]